MHLSILSLESNSEIVRLKQGLQLLHRARMDNLEMSYKMCDNISIARLCFQLLDQHHICLGLSKAMHYYTGPSEMRWRYHTKAWHRCDCKIDLQVSCHDDMMQSGYWSSVYSNRATTEHPLLDQIHNWLGSNRSSNATQDWQWYCGGIMQYMM